MQQHEGNSPALCLCVLVGAIDFSTTDVSGIFKSLKLKQTSPAEAAAAAAEAVTSENFNVAQSHTSKSAFGAWV